MTIKWLSHATTVSSSRWLSLRGLTNNKKYYYRELACHGCHFNKNIELFWAHFDSWRYIKKTRWPRHRGLGRKYSRLVFTWMRKVVGSNPDDGLYRTVSFSFAEAEADTSIEKRRLRDFRDRRETGNARLRDRLREEERQQCGEKRSNAMQEVVRINLLRIGKVAPSTIIVNIYWW